ncbi:MAG: hypothetical protein U0U46_01020 [Saprospiraceae bacterium]|nr:hypothetical protein [Saprospiraceae bacterium]
MHNEMTDSNTPGADDSLSFREIVLLLRSHFAEYRRKWLWVGGSGLLMGLALGLYAWLSPPQFTGSLTYMLNDNQAGRSGSFLSQFSSLLGVSAPGGQTFAQLTEISKSFRVVSGVLLQKATLNGQNDFIANHLIRSENLHETLWAPSDKDEDRGFTLSDFYFTRSAIDSFTRQEQVAIKSLYNALLGLPAGRDQLLICDYNDETGIMSISFTAHKEPVAAAFPVELFAALNESYLRSSTEAQARTLELVTVKTDSLRRVLEGKERSLARFQDQDNALLFQEDRLPGVRYERDRQMLGLMYGEAVKNREIADFALQNATPILQIIDKPFSPLSPSQKNPLQFAVLGSVLGGFLVCIVLSLRLLWREAMQGPATN